MINREWHLNNKMPNNPTKIQRLEWHLAHNKNCDCRKPSEKLAKEISEYLKEKLIN